jgi:hypothetical protein
MTETDSPARRRPTAPLLPPALAYALLTVCAVAVPPLLAGVRPWSSDAALLDFFRNHRGASSASAFFTLASAVPFALVTAVATTRYRTLGLDVPGRIIAQLGGAVAAALLAVAGLSTLALTRPHVAESAPIVRGFAALTFAAGGPGFVVFQGLLLAGLSVAGLIGRVLPRWLGWAGVGIAAISEVASASAAFDALDPLLPVGRFGGLAVLVAIAVLLPATRRDLRARRTVAADARAAAAGTAG